MDSGDIAPDALVAQSSEFVDGVTPSASKLAARENKFRRAFALGYSSLLPIVPPGAPLIETSTLSRSLLRGQDPRGKAPGMLRSDRWSGCDWQRLQATSAVMDTWHAWGAGTGLRLGDDRIAAVDFDLVDEKLCEAVFRRFCERLPHRHHPRIGRAPKMLVLVRIEGDEPITYRCVKFLNGQRVELLGHGRQCVIDGTHATTGNPYVWPAGMPRADSLLRVTLTQLVALFDELAVMSQATSGVIVEGAPSAAPARDQNSLRGSLDTVRSAVAALPNTTKHFPTRESYLKVGYAVKAALPDHPEEAYEIYDGWCARWEDPPSGATDPTETSDGDWARMYAPFRIGAGWLYHKATTLGGWQRDPTDFFGPLPPTSTSIFDEALGVAGATAAPVWSLVSIQDASRSALEKRARPLVKGLLDCGASSSLFGDSNVGKSFLALDIALHVAAGRSWGGRKTTRCAVLYVAAEGGPGFGRRCRAAAQKFGADFEKASFHLHLEPVDLRQRQADLEPLIAAALASPEPIGFIIIDTLSRALAGGDENSSTDMGAVVRHVDEIRRRTGAHVLVVHHTGKDPAKGARGHSLLRAALDTEIEVTAGQIRVTKQRDLDGSFSSAFRLETVTLGCDEEGDPITSCVPHLVSVTEEQPRGEPTPTEAEVLDAVQELVDERPKGAGVSVNSIVEILADEDRAMSPGTARKLLKRLRDKRLVEKIGKDWRPTTACLAWFSDGSTENPDELSARQDEFPARHGVFQ